MGEYQMYTIPANTMLFIGLGIVLSILGFVIYGSIKGFENILTDFDTRDYTHRKEAAQHQVLVHQDKELGKTHSEHNAKGYTQQKESVQQRA